MSVDLVALNAVRKGKLWAVCVWEPVSTMVVVGRGGTPEKEIKNENCLKDAVPVYRRATGGGAVVLSPGTLVFSISKKVGKSLEIEQYRNRVNRILIDYLEQRGVLHLGVRGISDLCIKNRKIMGSGIYRSRRTFFFQGSLLVSTDVEIFDRYLKHPPREPDYRQGRSHRDFVTTLKMEGYDFNPGLIRDSFLKYLVKNIDTI